MANKIVQTINLFQSKACCSYTQQKAHSAYRKLKTYLTQDELSKIDIAWSHSRLGEGNYELFEVCKELSIKYNLQGQKN